MIYYSTHSRKNVIYLLNNYNILFVLPGCFQQARDIFFAIDGTASVGSENFAKVRLFLEQFTKDLDLRAEKIRFGLLEFSDDDNTEVLFDFESAENREDVVSSLRDMQYHNIERRSIELALRIIKAFVSNF